MKHTIGLGLLGCGCAVALLACAQGSHPPLPEALPPPDLVQAASPAATTDSAGHTVVRRVVIQLRAPTQATDPVWLRSLQDQAQAPVHYVTAISTDTHVYALLWPTDRSGDDLLARLAQLPEVLRVEHDTRAKAH